jgi:tetratricopeptide (TPR) repeat protein
MAASENLYLMDPGPEFAHELAILHISRGDYQKAAKHLQMAVFGDNIDMETRAQWFYELAILSSANKEYCEAIAYAREAIANKSDLGKAYMTLGDVIIASRTSMKGDFEQRAAFWAAADKYALAASVDPSLAAEAMQKLNEYKVQYPDKEEIFFRELKDGASYRVKGCINEYTTVRARK